MLPHTLERGRLLADAIQCLSMHDREDVESDGMVGDTVLADGARRGSRLAALVDASVATTKCNCEHLPPNEVELRFSTIIGYEDGHSVVDDRRDTMGVSCRLARAGDEPPCDPLRRNHIKHLIADGVGEAAVGALEHNQKLPEE